VGWLRFVQGETGSLIVCLSYPVGVRAVVMPSFSLDCLLRRMFPLVLLAAWVAHPNPIAHAIAAPPDDPPGANANPPIDAEAKALWEQVARAYRDLQGYADQGRLVVRSRRGDQTFTEVAQPLSLARAADGRIALKAGVFELQAAPDRVVIDQSSLKTREILTGPLPSSWTLLLDRHPQIKAILAGSPDGRAAEVPLRFLLDPEAGVGLLEGGQARVRLAEPLERDGRVFPRLLLERPNLAATRLTLDPERLLIIESETLLDQPQAAPDDAPAQPAALRVALTYAGWNAGVITSQPDDTAFILPQEQRVKVVELAKAYAQDTPDGKKTPDQPGGGLEDLIARFGPGGPDAARLEEIIDQLRQGEGGPDAKPIREAIEKFRRDNPDAEAIRRRIDQFRKENPNAREIEEMISRLQKQLPEGAGLEEMIARARELMPEGAELEDLARRFRMAADGGLPGVDEGEAPPPLADPQPAFAQRWVGQMVPKFTLRLLESANAKQPQERTLDDPTLKDKTILLVFWATWSAASVETLAEVQTLIEALDQPGAPTLVIAVSSDDEPEDPAELVAALRAELNKAGVKIEHRPNGRLAIDPDQTLLQLFEIPALPSLILIDPNGVVKQVDAGGKPGLPGRVLGPDHPAVKAGNAKKPATSTNTNKR